MGAASSPCVFLPPSCPLPLRLLPFLVTPLLVVVLLLLLPLLLLS